MTHRAALIFALVVAGAVASAADWPLARGDAQMRGVGVAALPDQLAEVWAFKCGDAIETTPLVVGHVVYVACLDKHLYAIDLKTGQQVWKKKLGSFKASPGYDGGRVYVGDLEGKVYAVDAAKGDLVWTFETQGEIHAAPNFVAGDVLIGSHDSTLYRIDRGGKKAWEFKIDGPINGAAALAGDRTFVAGCDSLLHVVDVTSGKSLGSVDLGGQAAAGGAVEGDGVYVGTMTNQVLAVNWKTLKKSWEFEAKRRQQPFYSSAAVTKDLVVIGGRDKRVYALNRETGVEKWNFVTEGSVDASPVIVGRRVYVGCLSNTGEFYALDLGTGKLVQTVTLDSAVGGTVGVGPDCLLVGTDKGTLYKLGTR